MWFIPILCEFALHKFCRDVVYNVSTTNDKLHLHQEYVLAEFMLMLIETITNAVNRLN